MSFEVTFVAGWGDMDFNQHMANTAYLSKAADARFMFYASKGFDLAEFGRRQLGPVVRKDELEYFREFKLHDEMVVNLQMAAMSPDGARCVLRNEFRRGETLAARVNTSHGWVDLRERKLVPPPEELLAVLHELDRTEDFKEL